MEPSRRAPLQWNRTVVFYCSTCCRYHSAFTALSSIFVFPLTELCIGYLALGSLLFALSSDYVISLLLSCLLDALCCMTMLILCCSLS